MTKPKRTFDRAAVSHQRYAQGLIDESGTGRRVRAMICPKCHQSIMSGLDADLCAFTAKVDPTPIDSVGELIALMSGRRTYRLRWSGRYELDPRTATEIAAESPLDVEVLAEHRCGLPLPPMRRTPPGPRRRPAGPVVVPPYPPY